jgi:hypothetical protein
MPVNRKEVRLKTLPLRITPRQFDRLVAARARDALAIQEHVRRGIDFYLDALEKRVAREMQEVATPADNPPPAPRDAPKGALAAPPKARLSSKPAYQMR